MSSSSVWVQLYYMGKDEPVGQPVKIEPIPKNVGALKAVVLPKLDPTELAEVFVYPPGTTPPFAEQTSIRGDKNLLKLIDELKKETSPVSIDYDHPLLVVAPDPKKQPSGTIEPAPLPPATPRSKDVSNQLASVFEGEVNRYLDDHLQTALPRCNFSKFKNREIDEDSTALEMDSFSYMWNDSCEPSHSNPSLGIYVVSPEHIIKKNPAGPGKNNLKSPPGAQAANLARAVDKYIVGETYSGVNEITMKRKVTQLETKLRKMWHRHKALSGKNHADYTSLFGAAILAFTCISSPRSDQYKECSRAVLESLSCSSSPILWRLAQAGRFLIVVLSTSDAANTCALREIASGQQSMEIGIYNIEHYLAKIAEHIGKR